MRANIIKSTLLALFCSIFFITAAMPNQDWYRDKWDAVARFKEDKLPKSALSLSREIYNKSVNDNNQFEQLKALKSIYDFKEIINWKTKGSNTDSLMLHSKRFTDPDVLAMYNLYLSQELRANSYNRYNKEGVSNDFRDNSVAQWSSDEIELVINEHIAKVVNDSISLRGFSVEKIQNLLGSDSFLTNLPIPNLYIQTLFYARSVVSYMSDNHMRNEITNLILSESKMYGAATYLPITLYIYRDGRYSKEEHLELIEGLIKEFKDDPAVLIAQSEKLRILAQQNDVKDDNYYQNIADICEEFIRENPNSKYLDGFKWVLDVLNKSYYVIKISNQFYPNSKGVINVSQKNIKHLKIEVYPFKGSLSSFKSEADKIKRIKEIIGDSKIDLIYSKEYNFTSPLNVTKESDIEFDTSDYGEYLLVCKDEKGEVLFGQEFSVSRIGGVIRYGDDERQIYIADLLSGEPYKSITIKAKSNNRTIDAHKVELNGFTTILENLYSERNVSVYPQKGRDIYSKPLDMMGYSSKIVERNIDNSERIKIYTDRRRYKFNDTIHFKAYVHTSQDEMSMVKNKRCKFFLIGGNGGKRVAEFGPVKSDEWGGISGFFVISKDWSAGSYSIGVDRSGVNIYGNNNVNIDEFKEPTFAINLLPINEKRYKLGEKVKIEGVTKSYGGYSTYGSVIKYKVINDNNNIVSEGETVCNEDEKFAFEFKTTKEQNLNNINYYSIEVSATDVKGETHLARTHFALNGYYYSVKVDLPDLFVKEQALKPIFTVTNGLNGDKKLDNIKGQYTILKDSTLVLKGDFLSSKPTEIPWDRLKSGKYKLNYSVNGSNTRDISFVVFSKSDSNPPVNEEMFFYRADSKYNKNKPVNFILGTMAKKLYVLIELYDVKHNIIYSKSHVLKRGLEEFSIPNLEEYPDKLMLNITSIYNGKLYEERALYEKHNTLEDIKMKFISLTDKSKPNEKESFSIEVTDSRGIGQFANIVLTAYNKATDNPYTFNYTPLSKLYKYFNPMPVFGAKSLRKELHYSKYDEVMYIREMASENEDSYVMESEPVPFHKNVTVAYGSSRSMKLVGSTADLSDVDNKPNESNIRDDFRLTAAFITSLNTDKNGVAKVEFNYPDALSTYKIMAAAVTKGAKSAVAQSEVVVTKDVMIMASIPQFIRRGDKVLVKAQLFNKTNEQIDGEFNVIASGGEISIVEPKKVVIEPNSWKIVEFYLLAGSDGDQIKVQMELDSPKHKDIVINKVPIISDITRYNGSRTFILSGEKGISNRLNLDLKGIVGGEKRDNESLVIKLATPTSLLVSSMPSVINSDSKSVITQLNNWHISGVGIAMSKWYKSGREEMYREELERAFAKIKSAQNGDGGFPWYSGMSSSSSITLMVLERLNDLIKTDSYSVKDVLTNQTFRNAIKYIDKSFREVLEREKESKRLSYSIIDYIYVRSMYLSVIQLDAKTKKAWDYYVQRSKNEWTKYPLMSKVLLAISFERLGMDFIPMVNSIKEYAVEDKMGGVHFPNAVMPYRGMYHIEAEVHALILDLMISMPDKDNKLIEDVATWLMVQRKYQDWRNNSATASVLLSLWDYYKEYESSDLSASITSKNGYKPKFSSALGYEFNLDSLRAAKYDFEAINSGFQPLFVDVAYYSDMPILEIESQSKGCSIERLMYRVGGENKLELIDENTELKIGDKVSIRYHIKGDVNASFVQLKAMRTGALQPVINTSGYNWNGYYREVKSNETIYSFYVLPEGETTIIEEFTVWNAGTYSDGYVSLESLFTPVYGANNEVREIEVQ